MGISFFYGDEDYLRKQYKDRMKDALVGDDAMNYSYFEGKGVSVKELIDDIVEAGVKGIWNFSYLDVEVPSNVALVNVHLSDSLMTLAYKLNEIEHFENIK